MTQTSGNPFTGFPNFSTWAVYCWLTEDSYCYTYFKAMSKMYDNDMSGFARLLRERCDQMSMALVTDAFTDMLVQHALIDADYMYIACKLLSE